MDHAVLLRPADDGWVDEDFAFVAARAAMMPVPLVTKIHGTPGDDFIHQAGDGHVPPPGYNEITRVGGSDDITPGGGTDIVYGGDGETDIIIAQPSDISGLAEYLDGGKDRDDLGMSLTGTVDLSKATLVSIEELAFTATNGPLNVILNPDQFESHDYFNYLSPDSGLLTLTLAKAGKVLLDHAVYGGNYTIVGSSGDDQIRITGARDGTGGTIEGGDGNDVIVFKPGDNFSTRGDVLLEGGAGHDVIVAGGAHSTLDGGGGGDHLVGALNDRSILDGGGGNDILEGGKQADRLTGGGGADRFVFGGANYSGPGQPDTITDFSHMDDDRINLSRIDGDTTTAGVQGFHFVDGGAFTGHAGELIQFADAHGDTVLQGDTDGDAKANFEIILQGGPVLAMDDIIDAASAGQPAHAHAVHAYALTCAPCLASHEPLPHLHAIA